MPQLPNHLLAEIDITKLLNYCLSDTHPRGRHKARVLASALGVTGKDATWLKFQMQQALETAEATRQEQDSFGERWRVDMQLTRQNKKCVVRTIWIVRAGQTVPRFVTCWVE